jgi:hypothetical protein
MIALYIILKRDKLTNLMTLEKDIKNKGTNKLVIEDRINRYDLRFINPHLDKSNNDILYAQGEKGMFAPGAELNMEILRPESLKKEGEDYLTNTCVQEKEDCIQR